MAKNKDRDPPIKKVSAASARKIGRDAKTGQFIPVKEVRRRPNTTVIETIKTPKKKK